MGKGRDIKGRTRVKEADMNSQNQENRRPKEVKKRQEKGITIGTEKHGDTWTTQGRTTQLKRKLTGNNKN